MSLYPIVEQLESVFDQAYVDGSDDELFASGYLRGHFDLVVAKMELNDATDPAQVMPNLRAAVEGAKHELAPADQAHIQNLMDKLDTVAASVDG
ncbi:MAG: YfcL family protein [Pseudomonadota bacterium]